MRRSDLPAWFALVLPLVCFYLLHQLYRSANTYISGVPAFNPLVAASLHNELVSKIPIEELEEKNATIIRNWFKAYNKDAAAVRGRLSTKIIKFLENIDVPKSQNSNDWLVGITPHLALSGPGDLWVPVGGLGERLYDRDWIVLYRDTVPIQSDMYFDMKTNLVTYQEEVIQWNRDWYPLERVLRMWNHMYDTGRFKSRVDNDIFPGRHHMSVRPYPPSDFELNLKAWDEYLEAIVQHCPSCEIGPPGLIDKDIIYRWNIGGFLRDFLLNARRPNFNFIAPGLQLPTSGFYESLLAADKYGPRWHHVREHHIVLDEDYSKTTRLREKHGYDFTEEPLPLLIGPNITARSLYFSRSNSKYIFGNLSGLYSWPEEWFADSVSLVLPAPLGPEGFLSQSRIDRLESRNPWELGLEDTVLSNHEVFSLRLCPFTSDSFHKPRLFSILRAWKRLVEKGIWQVGPDGIKGGIEKFQDAKTNGRRSQHYRLGACFDEDLI